MVVMKLNGQQKSGRVLVYARFSTDDQNPRSTADQVAFCKRWLQKDGYADAEFVEVVDEGISGEVLSRPGIDKVKELIKVGNFAVLIGEDVSRFWRDRNEPGRLAGLCVDHGTRFVTINDHIDTGRPTWEDDVARAAGHHASANRDTSERIKRAADGRWDNGFAMAHLLPGYKRKPVDPVTYDKTRKGPFVDEKDAAWTPVIEEIYQRVARGDRLWEVAEFATGSGLPKVANSLKDEWTDHNILSLVKNGVYMGLETYRQRQSQKHYGSGRHVAVRSDPEDVLSRQMPHLAHVSPLLWQEANTAIAKRDRAGRHPKGPDNPTYRIPRDSRSPLAGAFFCAACGGKMSAQGRSDGGYRCGNALRGQCWNRATSYQSLAHERILAAVCRALLNVDGAVGALVEFTQSMHREDGELGHTIRELQREVARLGHQAEACAMKCLQYPDSEAYEQIRQKTEDALRAARAELRALESQAANMMEPPTREQILASVDSTIQSLDDREAWSLVRCLITPIQAMPYQRIDCDLVVLRARFRLHLLPLLPDQWQALARRAVVECTNAPLVTQQFEIVLYDEPAAVRLAVDAVRLRRQTPSLTGEQVALQLRTTRWTAYRAIQLGAMMEQRQLAEPYVELREAPARAARWGWRHRQAQSDGDQGT